LGSTTSVTQNGLVVGNKYCYRVRAVSSGNVVSVLSPETCVTPTEQQCQGQWNAGLKFTVGQIEERYLNTCPAGTRGQVRYWHTCLSGGLWSADAQSDNCTVYLVPPSNLSVSNTSGGVQVTWTFSPGATYYYINRGGYSYTGTSATSFVDQNVTDGGYYCYSVKAYSSYNGEQYSDMSSENCVTYRSGQPSISPPSNVRAAQYFSNGRKGIILTWAPAAGAKSYYVYRYDRTGIFAPLSGSDTSFIDWSEMSQVSGISYCYYIRSSNGSSMSTASNDTCSIAP
jgi:hypothetical protein